MKLSIITATFNSAAHVTHCIASVNSQSCQNLEHIIVDGASKDNTLEIIRKSPSRIAHVVSEPDSGIYEALNKGISLATGDIIGFLHADDVFASGKVLEQVERRFHDINVDGVYGDLLFINDENRVVRTWKSNAYSESDVLNGWMPPHPTLFLRKEVYQKYGLYDTSFRVAGDYDFMLRILLDRNVQLEYIPEVITMMKMGGVSTGNLKSLLRKSKEDIRALRNNGFRYPWLVLAKKNLRKIPQLFVR